MKDLIRLFFVLVTVIVLPKILSFFQLFWPGVIEEGKERPMEGGKVEKEEGKGCLLPHIGVFCCRP